MLYLLKISHTLLVLYSKRWEYNMWKTLHDFIHYFSSFPSILAPVLQCNILDEPLSWSLKETLNNKPWQVYSRKKRNLQPFPVQESKPIWETKIIYNISLELLEKLITFTEGTRKCTHHLISNFISFETLLSLLWHFLLKLIPSKFLKLH